MNDPLEERYHKANKELLEIIDWANAEEDKISQRLREEGAPLGLDTNRDAYAPIQKEYKHRCLALFDKYDLPNKPNLKID